MAQRYWFLSDWFATPPLKVYVPKREVEPFSLVGIRSVSPEEMASAMAAEHEAVRAAIQDVVRRSVKRDS